MSKLNSSFESIARLTVPAAEEAYRLGHPAADVEHVLLALLISQTPAGEILRSQGLHLEQARVAVQKLHAERISGLGMPQVTVPPRSLPADGPRGIPASDRVLRIFSRSAHDTSGFSLLRDLRDDGGGFVTGVLERLGIDDATLRSAMQQANMGATATSKPFTAVPLAGMKDHSYESFVPAPVSRVWELLDAPERRPEWDVTIDMIEPDGKNQWIGHTFDDQRRATRSGRIRVFRLTQRAEHRLLEWEQHLPLLRRPRPTRLLIHLDEQPGGTRLYLTMRRPRSVVPLPRFFFTIALTTYANSISRALRS